MADSIAFAVDLLVWISFDLTCQANSSVFSSRRFETLERNDQAAKVESFEELFEDIERTYSSVLCNARASLKLANLEEEKLIGVLFDRRLKTMIVER